MNTLRRDAARKLRSIEDALAHYSLDGDNLRAALEALRDAAETDKVVLYNLTQRPTGDDLVVDREVVVEFAPGSFRAAIDEYFVGRGTTWGAYNPVHPEPAQRDRVLRTAEVTTLTEGRVGAVVDFIHRRVGAVGFDTMRALVCDGPSMLAWVGIIQREDTTERQREILTRVLPAFRKRLAFERLVSESSATGGALAAALDHVNGAAWVLGRSGTVAHANAAGRARFDADPTATRDALAACAAGSTDPRFRVTRVRGAEGVDVGSLVVEVPDGAPRTVSAAARRLNLTPAQTRVLERVARGASNATIAAALKVAERTVEAHVTAILVKAQVPSRSALIAQIYGGTGGG